MRADDLDLKELLEIDADGGVAKEGVTLVSSYEAE